MLLAVLDTRCGLVMGPRDVYLNVAGGLKIGEPAADLAVAAALVSSLANDPVPEGSVFFGEIGLAGEIRAVAMREARLKEAAKLGFTRAIVPRLAGAAGSNGDGDGGAGLDVRGLGKLDQLLDLFDLSPSDGPR
jgi:DNA repair protein RadA/Sms